MTAPWVTNGRIERAAAAIANSLYYTAAPWPEDKAAAKAALTAVEPDVAALERDLALANIALANLRAENERLRVSIACAAEGLTP
jgi:hypothetical protein